MFTKLFWKDALERAISTFAQVIGAVAGGDGLGLLKADLQTLLIVGLLGALGSIIKSIGAYKLTDSNSASLVVDAKKRV